MVMGRLSPGGIEMWLLRTMKSVRYSNKGWGVQNKAVISPTFLRLISRTSSDRSVRTGRGEACKVVRRTVPRQTICRRGEIDGFNH